MRAKQYCRCLSARLDDDGCSRKYRIQQRPEGATAKHRDKGPSSALKLPSGSVLPEMSAGRSAERRAVRQPPHLQTLRSQSHPAASFPGRSSRARQSRSWRDGSTTATGKSIFFPRITLLTCDATSFSPVPKILIASFLGWYGCKSSDVMGRKQ